jgi:hypothetical protein
MSLENYSDAELKAELKARKNKPDVPQRLNKTDKEIVDQIFSIVESCLNDAVSQRYWDDDYDYYIFDGVMEAFYGDHYFDKFHNRFFNQVNQ